MGIDCKLHPALLAATLAVSAALAPGAGLGAGATPAAGAAEPPKVVLASDNPLSGDPEAIARGRRTYTNFCAQCHGHKADGVAPRFGPYAADLRTFNKGFYEFVGIVVEGIVDKRMPPWGEYFDGDQISEIGAYLETLSIEGAKWTSDQ